VLRIKWSSSSTYNSSYVTCSRLSLAAVSLTFLTYAVHFLYALMSCHWTDDADVVCVGAGFHWISGSDNPRVGRSEDSAMCSRHSCAWRSSDGSQSARDWRLPAELFFRCCEHALPCRWCVRSSYNPRWYLLPAVCCIVLVFSGQRRLIMVTVSANGLFLMDLLGILK